MIAAWRLLSLGVNLFVASKMADLSLESPAIHLLPHILAVTAAILILT